MSDNNLRRSSRRNKKISYKVGDVVEVIKGSDVLKGRLVSQVEGSPSKEPMWNVTFDEYPNMKDETILESMLGSSGSDTDSTNPPPPPTPAPTPVTAVPESQAKRLTPGQAQTAAATAARKKNRKGGTYHKKRPPAGAVAKASKKSKPTNGDEEVVKVPMLTGTLYLYRGIRRRAEFIRRI